MLKQYSTTLEKIVAIASTVAYAAVLILITLHFFDVPYTQPAYMFAMSLAMFMQAYLQRKTKWVMRVSIICAAVIFVCALIIALL